MVNISTGPAKASTPRSQIRAYAMSSFDQVGLPASYSVPSEEGEQLPPSYTEYPTELPTTFPICKHEVPPLVNVTDPQAHLRFLGAFERFKYLPAPSRGLSSRDSTSAPLVSVPEQSCA